MEKKFFILFCALTVPLYSQTKTYVREYTYLAGEADSKITSRAIALDQVKRLLLEEIGVYLQSTFETTKEEHNGVMSELTKEQIQSITAGVTETKILEEKWTGSTYYIKAAITVNAEEVANSIARIARDKDKLKQLEEATERADSAYKVIEHLRTQLASEKDENEKLRTQSKYDSASNLLSASDWFQRGYNADGLGDFDEAIRCYRKVIELDPSYVAAYYNLGGDYYNKGDVDEAISLYEEFIKLYPSYSACYVNLGVCYRAKGNIEKAVSLFEKAISLDAKNSMAYNDMAIVYEGAGEVDKAISLCKKAIAIDPTFSLAYYNLGRAYDTKGDVDEAIQAYEKSIDLNPEMFQACYNLANDYDDKGDVDKSIYLYRKAIGSNPSFGEAYYNLGLAMGKKGNIEEKIACYKKAARLGIGAAKNWLSRNGYTW